MIFETTGQTLTVSRGSFIFTFPTLKPISRPVVLLYISEIINLQSSHLCKFVVFRLFWFVFPPWYLNYVSIT